MMLPDNYLLSDYSFADNAGAPADIAGLNVVPPFLREVEPPFIAVGHVGIQVYIGYLGIIVAF